MSETFRARNRTALALLVLGKLLGIAGLIVGAGAHRALGALLLGLDGVFLVAAVALCFQTMKRRDQQDASDKQRLAQMIREGTLGQHLRDLKAEGYAPDGPRPTPGEAVFS